MPYPMDNIQLTRQPSVDNTPSSPIQRTNTMHSRYGSADGLFPYRVEKTDRDVEIISIPYVPEGVRQPVIERLRINDDGLDHINFDPSSFGFVMTTAGCALAIAGSQIVPLLYLTIGSKIAYDLDSNHLLVWLLSAIIVAQGVFAPFVGPLADLFGRKTFFIASLVANVMGAIVCSATPNIAGFIAGQVLFGFGTVTEELLAISVVGESVPTSKRPLYGALILCAIIPWSPGTMYANWITSVSWRYVGLALAIWNAINLVLIAIWYKPPPRYNARGLTKKEMIARIDFTGGLTITMALIFFLIGLNWGGNTYSWNSPHVVTFLVLAVVLFLFFAVWEWKFVRYPLFPRRMIHAPRTFYCMMVVIFCGAVNYIAMVVFWPLQTVSVFNAGRFEVGIYSIPIGVCMLTGAILSALLLGIFKNHAILVMFIFCVIQTVASACMAIIDPYNLNTAWGPVVFSLIGIGGVLVPTQVIITVITPDDLIASVTALTVGLRSQAQVIGLSLYYNRLVSELTKQTMKHVVPAMIQVRYVDVNQIYDMMYSLTAIPFKEYAQDFPQFSSGQNYTIVKDGTFQAFSASFEHVYLITIAFGVAASIAAACMGNISSYMDDHVAVML